MREVVVFDFDGTLTRSDTFITFARHALPTGRLLRGAIKSLPTLIAWKTGRIDSSAAKARIYSNLYKGLSRSCIEKSAASFRPDFRPDVIAAMQSHLSAGHEVWLITASLDLWMTDIAHRLGVNLLCTPTATADDGTLTGTFARPNCRGEEKVNRLREALGGLDDVDITLYGNELSHNGGDAALARIARRAIDLA